MRRTAIKRKTPLRRVSRKQSLALRKYYRLRVPFLAGRPYCEACFIYGHKDRFRSTEVHHAKGRGKYLNDMKTWFAICGPCHQRVHQSPNEARELGLLK